MLSNSAWSHMRKVLEQLLKGRLVGFNVPFDLGVTVAWFPDLIDAVFQALDEDRIYDIAIAERLDEIATGRPQRYDSLKTIASRYGVAELDKDNSPRLDYGRFLGADSLPPEHRRYALEDGDVTLGTWWRVRERSAKRVNEKAIAQETRHAFWLHLVAAWGIRTNIDSIEALRRAAIEAVTALREQVIEYGFIRADGSKDTKAIKQRVLEAYGDKAPPLTKTGRELVKSGRPWDIKHVATDKVALEDSEDPLLQTFSEYGEWSSVLGKSEGKGVIAMLERGVVDPIHTTYRLAKSTRTTSDGPNVQNFRRMPGIRECVVPRAGHCFGSIDVGGLELGTVAQVIVDKLGRRGMADLINQGTDLHLYAACRLAGIEYQWDKDWTKLKKKELKQLRQFCKIANFGYQGFMGAETLVRHARTQGERIPLEQAIDLKRNWERTLPDVPAYLRWVKTCYNPRTDRYDFEIPGSPGIFLAGATIAGCANGHFQGLGAQTMKEAGWQLTKEAWTDRSSVLYGQHIVLFIHDEFIYEIPIDLLHPVMTRSKVVIEKVLTEKIPDVKMSAEPAGMLYWTKEAEAVYNEKGELQLWQG